MTRWALAAMVGCSGKDGPEGFSAECTPQADNVLRFDCAVTTETGGPVAVRILDGGAELATWTSETEVVTVWGLRPETTYAWEAFATDQPDDVLTGELTTGALPRIVDLELAVTTSGESQTGQVVFNVGCGTPNEALVVASAEGDVLWYQEAADTIGGGGFSVTEDGTLLVATKNGSWVGEWDLAGNLLLDLSVANGGLSQPVHHDIERRGGLTYVLNAKPVQGSDGVSYAMDGFDVIEGGSVVASWSMEGLYDPTLAEPASTSFWGGLLGVDTVDWAHANAIGLDAEGDLYLSLRYTDTILKIAGDPADPAFGEVRWSLVGDDDQPYPSDLTRISSAGLGPLDFEEQHHAWIDAAGDLMVWDNRSTGEIDSRALRFRIDEDAGTADLLEVWDAGRWCPGQGSAFVLEGGNVLADCMSDDLFLEIERETQAEVWRMEPTCKSGEARFFYRVAPIAIYPG